MSTDYINVKNSKVHQTLYNFVNLEVLPNLKISEKEFWNSFIVSANELSPENRKLLKKRDEIQKKLDDWYKLKNSKINLEEYKKFLHEIDYLVEEKEDFKIETSNVDDEIAKIAGPQLVVPVDNARYAINAANARWGSMYDALYGSDIIDEKNGYEKLKVYNSKRGEKVINEGREFLDQNFSLEDASWKNIKRFIKNKSDLKIILEDKKETHLINKRQFIGYTGNKENPDTIILKNNNLHIEIKIDANHLIGKSDKANICDIVSESAISTIMDLEDSVTAVDADDKVKCYRNWLGIMMGTLETKMKKNGKSFVRKLNPDKEYFDKEDNKKYLHGRSLLLIRNVGHLMTSSAIILDDGSEIPEGIMDAFITVLCAVHDFKLKKNSRKNSVYIVKPKMHGPEEVAFTDKIFSNGENVLKLEQNTIKMGIMDEERRTTVNLKECIRKQKKELYL